MRQNYCIQAFENINGFVGILFIFIKIELKNKK